MRGTNKPHSCLYKLPGNKCLICGRTVNVGIRFKGWSWWVRSCDRQIVGVIHDACLGDIPPDDSENKTRPWSRV